MRNIYVVIAFAITGLAIAYFGPIKDPYLPEEPSVDETETALSDMATTERLPDQKIKQEIHEFQETVTSSPKEPVSEGRYTDIQIERLRKEVPGYDAHQFFGRLAKNDENTEKLIRHIRSQNEKLEWSEPIRNFLREFHESLGTGGEMIVECGEALCVMTGDLDLESELQPLSLSFMTHLKESGSMNTALTQSWPTKNHGWVMFIVATNFVPPF